MLHHSLDLSGLKSILLQGNFKMNGTLASLQKLVENLNNAQLSEDTGQLSYSHFDSHACFDVYFNS